jgi:hypothetical protein
MATTNGTAEQLSGAYFRAADVSPDGSHACGFTWDDEHHRFVYAIMDLRNGALQARPDLAELMSHVFYLPSGTLANMFYLPDGRVATLERIAGKSIIRATSAGAAPVPMTPPSDDLLFFGAASRDGQIAISRGQTISDVVLISAK